MKIVALFACLLVVGVASGDVKHFRRPINHNQRIELAGAVQTAINNFIQSLSDPVDIAEQSVSALGYTATFKEIHVDGIHNLVVKVSVDVLFSIKVRIGVTLKELNASVGSWESNFPIVNGNGKAGITLKNVAASLAVDLSLLGVAQPSKVSISVENADFVITGVQNNDVLSQSITDAVNHVLNVVANDPSVHVTIQGLIDLVLAGILKGQ
ncbi:hypothetical protein FQR65_LT04576 [Abscondita terminalis]|nr:hypothetical protein FQR65_LT04576 [Abscondita terminalis]